MSEEEGETVNYREEVLRLVAEGKIKHTTKYVEKLSDEKVERIYRDYLAKNLEITPGNFLLFPIDLSDLPLNTLRNSVPFPSLLNFFPNLGGLEKNSFTEPRLCACTDGP